LQESDGKILTIDLPPQRHRKRYGPVLKLGRKIVLALVHVDSDSDHSYVRRFVLRAHLHQHTGYFAPIQLNVVRRLDRGLEAEFGANHFRDRFGCPNRQAPRIDKLDLGS